MGLNNFINYFKKLKPMLKGFYIVAVLVTSIPLLLLHGIVGLLLWKSEPWDSACLAISEMVDENL